jgi:hypothetical protein
MEPATEYSTSHVSKIRTEEELNERAVIIGDVINMAHSKLKMLSESSQAKKCSVTFMTHKLGGSHHTGSS